MQKLISTPKKIFTTKMIAFTGLMTAMVMIATLLGINFGSFYFNVGDSIILVTSYIFGPIPGMIAGGLGSFFADMIAYPLTMLFTLVIKGLEGLLSGILFCLVKKLIKSSKLSIFLNILAMAVSTLFMMLGYFICQTFMYGTHAAALIALPMDALQATLSTFVASLLLFVVKMDKFYFKLRKFETPQDESDSILIENIDDNFAKDDIDKSIKAASEKDNFELENKVDDFAKDDIDNSVKEASEKE